MATSCIAGTVQVAASNVGIVGSGKNTLFPAYCRLVGARKGSGINCGSWGMMYWYTGCCWYWARSAARAYASDMRYSRFAMSLGKRGADHVFGVTKPQHFQKLREQFPDMLSITTTTTDTTARQLTRPMILSTLPQTPSSTPAIY